MHRSVTFVGLGCKNLSKVLKISIECIKLSGYCVQLVVNRERLCVRHILVGVLHRRSTYV